MRTLLFLFVTCFISCFGALANMGSPTHPHLFIFILFGPWILFFLHLRARQRRIDTRRRRGCLHEACMRSYLRKNGYRY